MKAFVTEKIRQVGLMDKPVPQPGPNDAIVKTTRALICTSDPHTVAGGIGPRAFEVSDQKLEDVIKSSITF
jgi:isopropanol dehydrogenase (NADP+)